MAMKCFPVAFSLHSRITPKRPLQHRAMLSPPGGMFWGHPDTAPHPALPHLAFSSRKVYGFWGMPCRSAVPSGALLSAGGSLEDGAEVGASWAGGEVGGMETKEVTM